MFNNKEFFWSDLGTGIFVVSNGNMLVNPKIDGNNYITRGNVYLSKDVKFLGRTWKEVLINLQVPATITLLKNLGIKFQLDLDDHDMCADGIMAFMTREKNAIENGDCYPMNTFSTFVTFNRVQHDYIKEAIRFGMKLFQYDSLIKSKNYVIERITDMRKMFHELSEDNIDRSRYNNEIISLNSELNEIQRKIDFIEKKR